ncbi:MAG: hypothetical protein K6F39_03135 [Lachnospiraceae bacterium]|nr:hypothetical protein [Lachnospiraceae bacterium]
MAKEGKFHDAINSRRIPILTLDNKWHKLFTQAEESKEMEKLEKKLNELMARQGKLNSELKDLKKIKQDLMSGIVANMSAAQDESNSKANKIVDESKRLIDETNEKMEDYEDELLELPRQIQDVNKELMLLTMEECYALLKDNTKDIISIGKWIKEMRVELKRRILQKQHMEIVNVEIYSWLQDIFGPDVMDMFDIEYDIEAQKNEMIARHEAIIEERERKKTEQSRGGSAQDTELKEQ